jgi:hypothetical protein
MTVHQNRIVIPSVFDIEVQIRMDSVNKQTELRITKGTVSHVQMLVLLTEHIRSLQQQLLDAEQQAIRNQNRAVGLVEVNKNGGTNAT